MFIEKVVIPFLESNELEYVRNENQLIVQFSREEHIRVHILESAKMPRLLVIVDNLVAFPKGDTALPHLLMELNSILPTKWIVSKRGEVLCLFDLLLSDRFDAEMFQTYFDYAMVLGLAIKPKLRDVRYNGKTLTQALEAEMSDGQEDDPGSDFSQLINIALGKRVG